MKKNLFYIFLCLIIAPFVFTSCDDDDDDEVVIDPGVEITLEKDEVEVGSGQIISVNILTGNGGYQVTSKNQDVVLASLSEEKLITLKAISTDHATATILIKDNKGREKELIVNVTPGPVEPVGLRLNKADLTLSIRTVTESAEVKIISGNSGYKIEYVEDAADFVTVDTDKIETQGTFIVKGIAEGSAVLKIIDSQKKEAFLAITIEYYPKIVDGEILYISGEGSEEGQQVKEVELNVFEIYTKIEADKPFHFYSLFNDEERIFSLSPDRSSFSATSIPEGVTLSETSVYRIKLNFETYAVSIEQIGDVSINVSMGGRDTKFEYDAKGVWKLDNYNVQITKADWGIEERYRIIFIVDGARECWGQTSPIYGDRPAITREGYRDMTVISNNEWDNAVFKFPAQLCDINNTSRYYTDATISMTADRNYTHDFENIRDSQND